MKTKLILAGIPVAAALLLVSSVAFAAGGSRDGNRGSNGGNAHGNTAHTFNGSNSNGNSWSQGRRNGGNDGGSSFNGSNRNRGFSSGGFNGFNGFNGINNGFDYGYNYPVVVNGYNDLYDGGLYNGGLYNGLNGYGDYYGTAVVTPFAGVNGALLEEVLGQGLGVQNTVLVNGYNSNLTLAQLALQNGINQLQFEANLQGLVNGGLINATQYNTLCSQGWNLPLSNIGAIL